MSQDHAALVRRGIAAYNRGDLQEALELWAPDAVWDWSNSRGLDAGVFRGRAEILAFWERLKAPFQEIRLEVVELVELGDDVFVVDNLAHLRGRDGIEVQARSAWLVKLCDGEQVALTLYQTKQEALEAAATQPRSQPK